MLPTSMTKGRSPVALWTRRPSGARAWGPGPAARRSEVMSGLRLWSTVAAVAAVGALALLFAHAEVHLFQADSYKALYDGRWIVQHGIPNTDVIAVADRGRTWVDQEWLAELLFYEAWRLGGFGLVAVLAAGSIAATYMILAWTMCRRGVALGWTVLFGACALLGLVHWGFIRAQDLALPLFAIELAICLTDSERDRPTRRLILLLPLLAVWANVHGSVLLGVAVAVAYLLWRAVVTARRGYVRAAALCAAMALVAAMMPLATPYGVHIVHYYREFGNPVQRLAGAEGRSPRFPGGSFFAVYVSLALVVVLTVRAIAGRRPAPFLLLGACALTAVAAVMRIGNLPWHTIVIALLLAEISRPWLPAREPKGAVLAVLTATAFVASIGTIGSLAFRRQASYEADAALRATRSVAADAAKHPCWLVLADHLDSGALLWHYPWLAGRIAFDARAEVFSPAALMRWVIYESGRGPRWPDSIWGYQLLVGNSSYAPALGRRLARFPEAAVLARDGRGIAVLNASAISRDPPGCSGPTS